MFIFFLNKNIKITTPETKINAPVNKKVCFNQNGFSVFQCEFLLNLVMSNTIDCIDTVVHLLYNALTPYSADYLTFPFPDHVRSLC